MSDTSGADQYLDSELNTLVGQFTTAVGGKTPTQAQITAGSAGGTGIAGQLANQSSNVGLLTQLNNVPASTMAQILSVASGYSDYSTLDGTGQQILQQIANVNNEWMGDQAATPDTFSYQSPAPSAVPTPAPPAASSTSATNDANAFADLQTTLSQYGLGSLTQFVQNELVQGIPEAQVSLDIMNTPEFTARFPAIAARQSAGLPAISPTDYIGLEQSYTQTLQAAGLPAGFYDQPSDFTNLITQDVSASEFQDRITNGFTAVSTAPPEVQAAFKQMFGVSGTAALAAYVMDPGVATPILEQQVQAANIAGIGTDYGFGLSTNQAMQLSQMGVTNDAAASSFKQGINYQSLLHGSASDPSAFGSDNVVAGLFGTTNQATFNLNQAVAQKQADFSGGGQANVTEDGVTGLGAARSM